MNKNKEFKKEYFEILRNKDRDRYAYKLHTIETNYLNLQKTDFFLSLITIDHYLHSEYIRDTHGVTYPKKIQQFQCADCGEAFKFGDLFYETNGTEHKLLVCPECKEKMNNHRLWKKNKISTICAHCKKLLDSKNYSKSIYYHGQRICTECLIKWKKYFLHYAIYKKQIDHCRNCNKIFLTTRTHHVTTKDHHTIVVCQDCFNQVSKYELTAETIAINAQKVSNF